MRVKPLVLAVFLALAALPALAAGAPASAPAVPQVVTLADILAPAPAAAPAPLDLAAIPQAPGSPARIACFAGCSVASDCYALCGCKTVSCQFVSACNKKVCNCTACP